MAGFRRPPRPEPGPEINQRVLKYRDVRVIGPEGEQFGIMQSRQALQQAKDEGLDLVMVSPTANPPVCKIIDYGKHKYLEGKQGKDKKSKQQEVKGIKISPRIAEHDLLTNVGKAIKFLSDGSKVKVTCMFKAREVTHPELGRKKLDQFAELVAEVGTAERIPTLDGRLMVMVLLPKPNAGKKKDAKGQNKQDGGQAVQDHGNGKDHAAKVAQQPPVPAQDSLEKEEIGAGAGSVPGRAEADATTAGSGTA
ncbi:MAG TPA: translation initiation factor IF-3 [Fimbriimonas sp.]|nr:translation initiation factor IF-3 [Fimbriimonas sp.]